MAELADHPARHPNAIRQQLAKLVDAGFVAAATAPPVGRGRPRLCSVLDASAESRWGLVGPYERLTLLLTEIIRTGDSPVDVGRRAARKAGAEASRCGQDVEIALGACPFETAAED